MGKTNGFMEAAFEEARAAGERGEQLAVADFARIASGGSVRAEPGNDWCAKAVAVYSKCAILTCN